jgi:hypothetical protein
MGLEPDRVEEKIGKVMTWRVDSAKPGQKSGCNPLTFFSLKRRRFDLYKKKIDPTNSINRSKPGTRVLNQAGHQAGLKTMLHRRRDCSISCKHSEMVNFKACS